MTNSKLVGTSLLMAALVMAGCSNSDDKTDNGGGKNAKTGSGSGGGGEHAHGTGPNGGVVFDLGKYHAEFTVDHPKEECTILFLGGDEKTTTAVEATELTLNIKATKTADGTGVPAMTVKMLPTDEKDGKATTFVGTDAGIANVADFEGTVLGQIDGKPSQGEFSEKQAAAPHTHGEDDALVWEGDPVDVDDVVIKLGHHGKHLHAGEEVEPAVFIERDGKPVDDAKVYNALLSADGETVLAEEVPTVYEPTTEEEPAHYAQGGLAIPRDVKKVVVRFRIVLPGADAQTFDMPIDVE